MSGTDSGGPRARTDEAAPSAGARLAVSCFIPAYDEEDVIAATVRAVDARLAALGCTHEVVVVDDASRDRTAERVRGLHLPHVRVVENAVGPSFRENLGRAMLRAGGDVLLFIDADLSPDPGAIGTLVERVRAGWDAAVGSRYSPGAHATRRPSRRLLSAVYNRALRLLYGSPFTDHQCGLKAFRREPLQAVLAGMHAREPGGRAWFWDAELLIRLVWAGYRVCEVPIRWRYRDGGHFMPARQVRMLPAMVRLARDRARGSQPDFGHRR